MIVNIRSSILGGGIICDGLGEKRSFEHGDGTHKILVNLKWEISSKGLRSILSRRVQEVSSQFQVNDFPDETFREGSRDDGGFKIEDDGLQKSSEKGVKVQFIQKTPS